MIFAQPDIVLPGHVVSKRGRSVDIDKIRLIILALVSTLKAELRTFSDARILPQKGDQEFCT